MRQVQPLWAASARARSMSPSSMLPQVPPDSPGTAPPLAEPLSFKVEVLAEESSEWTADRVRLASHSEARGYAKSLAAHWPILRRWRVSPSADPVSHRFTEGDLVPM